ncbi:SMP-30/gluconolactonase/LRE family protein [Geminicoccus harenae]|uniref:SMP-30/gluconolactonase/LRE family protein n=1 Tax=Geminicoccus harenae TaxID=2498453 RepID=UPI00168BBBE0|nr:SMP-30/gluconolactonase/LRE family protein [Geminicoccus harenae]
MRIELLTDTRDELGEGPLWDVQEQRLYWIDSHGKAVHRADARGQDRRSWQVPEHIGSMCLREGGGAVVSLRNGFHFLDLASGEVQPIADPEAGIRRTRMNDGKVDRQGRFVAGGMDYEEREPLAGLYRLDPDLKVTKLESDIIVSNGPCWSPDGSIFYFADSWTRKIWAYAYDTATGDLLSRRIFADFEGHLRGYPDGATVDEEGYVWSAEVYGGRLVRFAPDGTIDRLVGMPVDSITSVMFGGADLDILYVTSMARPFGGRRRQEREAGGLFAVHGLGVRGLPEPRFKG